MDAMDNDRRNEGQLKQEQPHAVAPYRETTGRLCESVSRCEKMTTTTVSVDEIPREFEALDESLRCKLCSDHFCAAVSIADRGCGHSFCSECIRNTFHKQLSGLKRQTWCPICRFAIPTNNLDRVLIPNRTLQEAILAFQAILSSRPTKLPMATPSPSFRSSRIRKEVDYKENAVCNNAEAPLWKPPSNNHALALSKKPLQNYAGKNRKKLQELCRRETLPTDGTEEELKERHRVFITLWNSETDAIKPRSPEDLVEVIKSREKGRRKETMFGNSKSDHIALKSMLENGKSGNHAFDQKFDDGFKALMERMCNSRQGTSGTSGTKPSRSGIDEEGSSSVQPTGLNPRGIPKGPHCQEPVSAPLSTQYERAGLAEIRLVAGPKCSPSTAGSSTDGENGSVVDLSSNSLKRPSPDKQHTVNSKKGKRTRQSLNGPWACTQCTFYNEKHSWSTATCEMCKHQRR